MTNSKEINLYDENEINSIYGNIKELVINSRNKVYSAVNTEMLNLYWNIGKIIMEIQQGDERASYGEAVLEKIVRKVDRRVWKRVFKKKFRKNEEILYSFSNCDNGVVAIELVTLFRTNQN